MNLSMRMVLVIVGLTAIALGVVHLRRREVALRYGLQRTQSRHAALRREVWDRQVEIGQLMTPQRIRHRASVMALDMTYNTPRSAQSTPQGWMMDD